MSATYQSSQSSADIREAFLSFFESKQHIRLPGSSLVPQNDPTLLFTNAGMVQFKDVFLGIDKRDYLRATTSQRCVRAGGKHNDLENVGYTARHHTFFEMLGNFSFGDYFKRDAIHYAWEFLTSEQWLNMNPDKLTVTVYAEDHEAYQIWLEDIGVPETRIIRIGDNKAGRYQSDNFWSMGDTGPCGPCTEIFYDHGEQIWGGPPGTAEEDGDRYIEIWNIVFMQFNRGPNGDMTSLSKPSVDTGMGLERVAAVMQGVQSNYEIDLFQNLLAAVTKETHAQNNRDPSLQVIADHIRSCAFLIADGVVPSNEGRGYVLRRIIRRAIRHGHKLGQQQPFFHKLVAALVGEMGAAYPELTTNQARIKKILLSEERQFEKTLENGLAVLESALDALSGSVIPGKLIFTLYDTYGFPTDLTNDIARERQLTLDMEGYERAMDQQRLRARTAGKFTMGDPASLVVDGETIFSGYHHLVDRGSVIGLFKDNQPVEQLEEGQDGIVVLSQTPFYAESGGQVGDGGYLQIGDKRFEVRDCQKNLGHHLHVGRVLSGLIRIGDELTANVDNQLRQAIALNHSATHLLHAALRRILGEHVTQKGSLVDSEKLRFDFSHSEAVTPQQLRAIEQRVNREIRRNTPVTIQICSIDVAEEKGAMMLFGEKYGDEVRLLSMGDDFSVELCGGTHVERTGDIGLFHIASESGISAGIRRVEAVTGESAISVFNQLQSTLNEATAIIKANSNNFLDKLRQSIQQIKLQERQLGSLRAKVAKTASRDLLSQAKAIVGVQVITHLMEGGDAKTLRDLGDNLKAEFSSGVFLLATVNDEKISLLAGVTKNLIARYKAGDLMREVAPLVGGKGGGRADLAQGGGTDVQNIDKVFSATLEWVARGK
ncbi:MAG: alanyl-tRNA synthetase [Cellvibrionaceae bacterium]|jgi:alanyl-tRNA synthetase